MAGRRSAPKKGANPWSLLESSGPAPVYVLDGERLLVDEFIAAVRAAVFPPGASAVDFNFDQFIGRDVALAHVLDAARTLPAFAPRRLVVVRQAEPLVEGQGSAKERGAEMFAGYLERPSPTTTLILAAGGRWDARTKLYRAAKKAGAAVRFEAPREREMPRAIEVRARKMGAHIEPDAVRALAEGVGVDLEAAVRALELLILYVGPGEGRTIRVQDVDEVVPRVREASIFALVDAVAEGNVAHLLEGIDRVLVKQREPALKFLALVTRHYRNLLRARVALDSGISRGELPSLLGVPPFALDGLLEQVQGGDAGRFARALASLSATDRALKGGSLGDVRAIERLAFALQYDQVLVPPESLP